MSVTTPCQSTPGSAAAAAIPTPLAARVDMAGLSRVTEDPRKGRRDALDLAVGHRRGERQRQRPRGDVLADGELPLAVAERLAVVGHQVDGRQVRLARDPVLAQRADD